VGGIRAYGVEVSGDYYFENGFGIFASGSWSSSEYTEDVIDASEVDGVLRVKGNQVVFTPTLQGFGELSYTMAGVTIAANAKYTGARPVSLSGPEAGDPSAQEELDSYVLIGGTARYEWRQFVFKVQGTNLLDESYLASTSGLGPGTARRPGAGTYFPGSPRWFTFGIGASF
jgi:outer membrane receptor protein involved in Fe transport